MHEKELIEKIKSGDENAFAALMQLYGERIFRHCAEIVKDEDAARDLVQEAFLKAYQHLDSFRMESSLYTWIWRIAHNLSLNYLKKTHPLPLIEDLVKSEEKKGPSEFEEYVGEMVQWLPKKQKEVFILYDLQRIPQKEIAERLKIPLGTVRSRLFYARKRMRELLGERKTHFFE